MLRSNLSTRPFYNERAIRALLGALATLAIGLTLFNAYEIVRLQGQGRDSRQTIAQNDAQARDLRDKAAVVRRAIDRVKLGAVQTAAAEANALIDRRTFSWTELLNLFQSTLPPDVRIAGVIPKIDNDGRRLVQISVQSRRAEDLAEFIEALEKTGAFSGVLSRADTPDEAGSTLLSELQAYYLPVPASAPAAASESDKARPSNQSASAVDASRVPR